MWWILDVIRILVVVHVPSRDVCMCMMLDEMYRRVCIIVYMFSSRLLLHNVKMSLTSRLDSYTWGFPSLVHNQDSKSSRVPFNYNALMRFCQPPSENFEILIYLTDCLPYATLAKPTRNQTVYETINPYTFYPQYIQIPYRISKTNKTRFYIYKPI